MSYPTIQDIVNVNKAIRTTKDDVDSKVTSTPDLDWDNASVLGCGDYNHGNIVDVVLGGKKQVAVGIPDWLGGAKADG